MQVVSSSLSSQAGRSGRARHCRLLAGAWLAALGLVLGGCSGSGSSGTDAAAADAGVIMPIVQALNPVPETPTAAASAPPVITGGPDLAPAAVLPPQGDPGLLLMLVPDGQSLADARIGAWMDAASEVGVRLQPVTDTEFLQLGAGAAAFAGLILPDDLHTRATDEVVAAVTSYTQNGGRTMLVYDFGALFPRNGDWFYAVPKSRLSPLAGVDYVLYDALRDRTTGLGPVTALRSTLRQLLVPPGKSLPYAGQTSLTPAAVSASPRSDLLKAAGVSGERALFLPVGPGDPGGVHGYDPQQYLQLRHASAVGRPADGAEGTGAPRIVSVDFGRAFAASAVANVTREQPQATRERPAAVTDPVDAYSGYILGNLIYPSYVTQGTFAGTTLAVSPQHGLVAGVNTFGAGQVLFVNLPLTYLKGRTDALPMHGFLHYFTRNMLKMAHLSAMPNAVAGLTLDWHLDSLEAQTPTLNLERLGVFSDPGALFPMEMTAGPDTVNVGDRLGWNLKNNPTAQNLLRRLNGYGHAVGSHGGWIHDYYGLNASDTNQFGSSGRACVNGTVDNYQQCLVLNRQAVDGTIGRASRNYSPPEGNSPVWAMQWLEDQGVVGSYFGGHTGLGATRQYRDGKLMNPKLWVFPVTPQGIYATFEEWQDFRVSKTVVNQWYRDLIDFSISQNTSRMVYAHPPGAYQWRDVLTAMLNYAKTQRTAGRFAWYTTTRLADFMATRLQVAWTQAVDANGVTQFSVSHPASLQEMVWRLPKTRYPEAPVIVSGTATVTSDDVAGYWLVKAGAVTSLSFSARATP